MTATSTLDVETLTAPNDLEAQQRYRNLITALAGGDRVSREQLDSVLFDSGRSLADLKKHLAIAKQLRDARQVLLDANKPNESLAKLRAARDEAEAAIKVELKRHEEAMAELVANKRAADDAFESRRPRNGEIGDAANLLNRHLTDAAKSRFRGLSNNAVGLSNRLVALRDAHSQLDYRVKRNRAVGDSEAKAILADIEPKLAEVKLELDHVAAQHAEASAAFDECQRDIFNHWNNFVFDLES
jgi:hypothetical protein